MSAKEFFHWAFDWLKKPDPLPLAPGDIVGWREQLCRVMAVNHDKDRNVVTAVFHFIDHKTGNILKCPDFGRCQHRTDCPIHGGSEVVREHGIDMGPAPFSKRDRDFFVEQGCLIPEFRRRPDEDD